MLPNILLYMLSTLVFIIPVESGEKVGFSMTILLAAVVSFGAISEMLPASSLNFPVIAYFLALVVSHMALDTFLTTIGRIVLIFFVFYLIEVKKKLFYFLFLLFIFSFFFCKDNSRLEKPIIIIREQIFFIIQKQLIFLKRKVFFSLQIFKSSKL